MSASQSSEKEPLTAEQYRRLEWYLQRQKQSDNRIYAMDDLTDRHLKKHGLLVEAGWASVRVTAKGEQIVAGGPVHGSTSSTISHRGIEHRLAKSLEISDNLVWENPRFRLPREEILHCQPDLFSLKKTLKDLRPTAYFFYTEESSCLDRVIEDGISEIAEYRYVVCPEGWLRLRDIPDPIGLIVETADHQWTNLKPAQHTTIQVGCDYFMQLMLERKGIRTGTSVCS